MPKIRVTKHFHFEMGHSLYAYNGRCRNIHGHSYKLEVTLIGEPKKQPGHPQDGMVFDFGELKKIVTEHLVNKLDHALLVNKLVPEKQQEILQTTNDRLIVVDFQPTSENLTVYIAETLQQYLPTYVSLFSVRLYETASSFAEWFASDNQ